MKRNSSRAFGIVPDSKRVKVENEEPRTHEIPVASTVVEPTGGKYESSTNEWQWQLKNNVLLRVTNFKGRQYVDIRQQWDGKPTKKGVSLPVEVFRDIQKWDKLDEALSNVTKGKGSAN